MLIVSFVIILLVTALAYIFLRATQLPFLSPKSFLKTSPTSNDVLVCIGDSITHGRVSQNYVDMIRKYFYSRNITVINAGINNDLAITIEQLLDEIMQCKPDVVTLLIGTNDVCADVSSVNLREFEKEKKIPTGYIPSIDNYKRHLTAVVSRLKNQAQKSPRIILLSLPVFGENTNCNDFKLAEKYSDVVKRVSFDMGVDYIPLGELMSKRLVSYSSDGIPYCDSKSRSMMYKAIIKRYGLRQSWEEISNNSGLYLTTDLLHLNRVGATIVAEEIVALIDEGYSC